MKIGIYGGSFNPIHFGHLIPVSIAAEKLKLDKVYFVVANRPPHKNSSGLADGKHRLKMAEIALASDDDFIVSDIEFQEGQKPYTVDLLASFRKKFPKDKLHLLIGADSLFELKSWYKWELLFLRADMVAAMARQGFPKDKIDNDIIANSNLIGTPLIEISATGIRQRIKQKKTIKYLVPKAVENYINRNILYTE
ncbi:MAG: nicotinate-nucleotide adenylyltransferase [Candidatus Zixiibacteriota bacterium]